MMLGPKSFGVNKWIFSATHTAQWWSQAREFAARFLLEQEGRWEGDTSVDAELRGMLRDAPSQFALAADALSVLQTMYPCPQADNPNDDGNFEISNAALEDAKTAEKRCIELGESIRTLM